MRLAVIPARGGSRRIPGKNIRNFHGKPIIAYSINAAKDSGLFDHIIVSTDNQEIADVAKKWGAEAPFMRPAALADDHTGTLAVIRHAVDWFSKNGGKPDHVCCIYATAPLLQAADLITAYKMFIESDLDYAVPVTTFPFPIQRALKRRNDGLISMFYPEYEQTRSQDLEEAWHDSGQFYWGRADAFLQEKALMTGRSLGVPFPRERVQDIDTETDWQIAEQLFLLAATGVEQ